MNEVDRKYEEWLNEIRGKQPILTNPQQLTADILQKVSALKMPEQTKTPEKIKRPQRLSKRLYLPGTWISGIAAVILLCFLLEETTKTPVKPEYETPGFVWESAPSSVLPTDWKSMTLTEKRSYLSACRIKQEQQRQLNYKKIENKLLKQMNDENK